jgi:hypothetical protein
MATEVLGNVAFPSRVRMGLGSASPFRGRVTIPEDRYVQPSTFTLEDAFRVSAPGLHQAPYLGIPKIVPPSDGIRGVHSHDSHGCPRDSFRPAFAKGRSRSVFEVSHLLDGLHHRESCGFVAPRCRSWDSRVATSESYETKDFLDARPFGVLPSTTAFLSLRNLPSCHSFTKANVATGFFAVERVRYANDSLPSHRVRYSHGFFLFPMKILIKLHSRGTGRRLGPPAGKVLQDLPTSGGTGGFHEVPTLRGVVLRRKPTRLRQPRKTPWVLD